MDTTLLLRTPRCLILMGASTGGTRILVELLSQLPPLPAAIVIVQHMPKFINASLVQSLSQCSRMPVCLASDTDRLLEGQILVAPSDFHLSLVGNRSVALTEGPKVNYVRPAVDVMMQSARRQGGQQLIGVLLTGMGRDGADGMRYLKGIGATTIVQNQATCAVYGMPAEAMKTGCIDHQLPPAGIVRLLQSLVNKSSGVAGSPAIRSLPLGCP